ncbi:unnamed protein product [Brassicogethes aeneus]|uniref:Invertebrate defensins family profile domain-containing protein n=1 Tax=Brassicogethes aeneus TaxID=1431903 RepID=A0A9P0B2T5_BRAAE|nr:unnamed protein product [Brassicogethes aeneus]
MFNRILDKISYINHQLSSFNHITFEICSEQTIIKKMKTSEIFVICVIFSTLILNAYSAPLSDLEDEEYRLDHVGRVKRVTCDVLSGSISILGSGGQLNHTACALHCLTKGKKGGHCDSNAVCVCR